MRLTFAAIIFAVGIFLGIQYAKPPPPPDFDAVLSESSIEESEANSKTPTQTGTDEAESGEAEADEAAALNEADGDQAAAEPIAPAPPEAASNGATQDQPVAGARIAIIIDDLGRSLRDLDTLAALGVPLTYSVLPFETKTPEVVSTLRKRGAEILCHLPMEAQSDADPGPGALRLSMNRRELATATRRALAAVPGAIGVNNHMGSGVTADRKAMKTILDVIDEVGLSFIDSRTSSQTVGYELARRRGMPAARRQVFLDNDRSPEALRKQFQQLMSIASREGEAIAIGHPYPETLAMLDEQIPVARRRGIRIVTAGSLLR